MKAHKFIIAVDLDAIVVDLKTPWLAAYNREYNDTLTPGAVTDWSMTKFVKPECGSKIFDILRRPGFYRHLPPLGGALAGVKSLRQAGHRVIIATAGMNDYGVARDKLSWIEEFMPEQRAQDIFIGEGKSVVRADFLIDDAPKNLRDFPNHTITIDYPYNIGIDVGFRAHGWEDTTTAWAQIVKYLRVCSLT